MTNAQLLELLDRSDQIHNYVKHYTTRPGKLYEMLLGETTSGIGYSLHGTRTFRLTPTMTNEQQIKNLEQQITQKRTLVAINTDTVRTNTETERRCAASSREARMYINQISEEIKQLEDQIADLRKRTHYTYKISDIFKRVEGYGSQSTYTLTRVTHKGMCLIKNMTNDQYSNQNQNYSNEITNVENVNAITVEELNRIMAGLGSTFKSCDPSRPLPWE